MYYMDLRLVVKRKHKARRESMTSYLQGKVCMCPTCFLQMTIYSLAERNGNRSWTSYICISKHWVSKLIWRKTIFFFFFWWVNCILHSQSLKVIGFYTFKFQNLDFIPMKFGFYILTFQNLDFIPSNFEM